MAWTEAQEAAMNSRGQTLLLSAAAGSGKTAVLVERLVRRLLDRQNPIDMTAVLVVTFTKAAAAEMRERIGAALTAALEATGRPDAERQLALLPAASISTLHSFCQEVIRTYFYTIDLDPAFRVAGEEELSLLRKQVLEDLLLSYYEQEEKADVLYPLADMFGTERGDDNIVRTVERMYQYSRSMPFPEQWLRQAAAAYDIPSSGSIEETPWWEPVKAEIRRSLQEAVRQYEWAVRQIEARPALQGVKDLIYSEYRSLQGVLEKHTWEMTARAVKAVTFTRLPALRKLTPEDKACWEACKKIRTDSKKLIQDKLCPVYFAVSSADLLDGMRAVLPVMKGLVQVTSDFAAAYEKAKREKGWIDFSDLEHLCLKILSAPESTPDRIVPSAVARKLQEKYAEVLIDEYQDTNGVQELITQLVSRTNNRFMVGDIKQSIYRFRLADPSLFLEKYKRFRREPQAVERCIDLNRNFRSMPQILAAVNEVFAAIMTEEAAGLAYGEREFLHAGRGPSDHPHTVSGRTEVCLLSTGEKEKETTEATEATAQEQTAFEQESAYIAEKIQHLLASHTYITEKDGTHTPLSYGHIVILLRSPAGKAEVLVQALQQAGIPSFAEQNGGYFAAIEVQIMLSLLQCIDNPQQDIPLAAVLRSPLVGVSEACLAELRLLGAGPLWRNAARYITQGENSSAVTALQQFLQQLESWRTYSRRHSVAELIWRLFSDTAYYEYVGGLPGGSIRQANLKALYERARQYEEHGFRGLFRYLRLLDKMKEDGVDLAPAKVAGEKEDVVRIMSIHKSKGLEFPVVIVADMGKAFNRQDWNEPILFHHTLGIGLKQYDTDWRMSYPTLAWNGIRAQSAWESTAEEERILYVAMTRAKELLLLIGHTSHLANDWNRWCQGVPPERAKSYWDWVMPTVLKNCRTAPALTTAIETATDGVWQNDIWQVRVQCSLPAVRSSRCKGERDPRLAALQEGNPTGTEPPAWLEERLQWRYAYPQAVTAAAKMSVSEIKRQQQEWEQAALQAERGLSRLLPEMATEEDPFVQPPLWEVTDEKKMTGAAYGTAMHKAMQYIAGNTHAGLDEIRADLVQWEKEGIFSAAERAAIKVEQIRAFWLQPLGKRMAASPVVHREYPFSVLLQGNPYLPTLEAGEAVLVQGVLDVLFQEGEEWVILDYKTDRLSTPEAFRERYHVQLAIYKQAVEQVTGRKVKEVYIYSFHLQQAVAC